jgi:hypothetical protein
MLRAAPLIPTAATCDEGQASVLQMDSVFQSLSADLQSHFQSAHDAIMASYNGTWYTGIDWIGFNPACGTMYNIGAQADALTVQMQTAEGQATISAPGPSTGSADLSLLPSLLGGSNTVLLIVGGLVVLYLVVKR